MDMDLGDVQKESIDKGSEPTLLEGAEYSLSLIEHNDVGPMISHNKPKKDANLNVIAQGIFLVLLTIIPLSYWFLYSINLAHILQWFGFFYRDDILCLYP